MKTLMEVINMKVRGVIWSMISAGILLVLMALLIVWTDFFLRLVIGLFALVVAYVFFYGAYKIWSIKRELEKLIFKK